MQENSSKLKSSKQQAAQVKSGNAFRMYVLREDLNEDTKDSDRSFQSLGALIAKAMSPLVFSLDSGIDRIPHRSQSTQRLIRD